MASHAMALIAARGKVPSTEDAPKPAVADGTSKLDAVLAALRAAECDLRSSQPPLRARGVVSLRHVARSLSAGEARPGVPSVEIKGNHALIAELESGMPVQALSAKEEMALIAR